jgi:hypothetical protein
MSRVRLAPDRLGLLGLQRLERDRVHRRDRGELDEALRFSVTQLRGNGRERIEACNEKPGRSFGSSQLGHPWMFAKASDVPLTFSVPDTRQGPTGQ